MVIFGLTFIAEDVLFWAAAGSNNDGRTWFDAISLQLSKQQQILNLLEWLETNSRHGAPEVVLEPVLLARERGRRLLRRGRLHLLDVRLHDHVLGQRGQRR